MKTRGAYLIQKERERQIEEEGWTEEHDKHHTTEEFIKAAIAYLMYNIDSKVTDYKYVAKVSWWPWDKQWYKPKTKLRNLVRAGALIAAAIDKLQKDEENGMV